MTATTEDFEKARQDRDVEANQNSNTDPIPWHVSQGRFFMGIGRSEGLLNFRQFSVQFKENKNDKY